MQRREFAKLALLGGVGAIAAPAVVKATDVRMPRRLAIDRCCGVLVDVQGSFLDQVDASRRDKIIRDTTNFARLLGFYKVPVVRDERATRRPKRYLTAGDRTAPG